MLGCVRPQLGAAHVHVILQSKACNERKDINMDILLLANWQNLWWPQTDIFKKVEVGFSHLGNFF